MRFRIGSDVHQDAQAALKEGSLPSARGIVLPSKGPASLGQIELRGSLLRF
jgi:hypothetical protein